MRARFNDFVVRHEVAWELTMGVLAIAYVVVAFASDEPNASPIYAVADVALTGLFALEFAVRFGAAYDRLAYVRGHWIDLVALIPAIRQFRVLRLLRLLRLVRAFASVYRALVHVERLLGNRQIAGITVVWLGVLVLSSLGLYAAENGVNEAVTSPLDALWWGIVTMTTVGYGDVYPITPEGRLAAAILMILGIALFGVITATATGLIVRGGQGEPAPEPTVDQIKGLFQLMREGGLSVEEYEAKKAELLARI